MNQLAEMLSSRTRAELFRLLFGTFTRSLHLREIERITNLSTGSLRQEIAKLQKLGLITVRKDGNRICYEPNRAHPLYQDIRSMVLKTNGLTDVLKDAMQDSHIEIAFVFGSVARNEETADSDIDLMVIGSIGLRKLSGLLAGTAEKVGREINPHIFSLNEFRERLKKTEHLISSIMASPKLFIIGNENDLEELAK